MKSNAKLAGVAVFAVIIACAQAFAASDNAYKKMAQELSDNAHLLSNPKIAIVPFQYIDKRQSAAGNIISERLTTRIVKIGKLKVIERSLLENVMQELHLETTGIVDAESTKELGKVLGVEAIINGTIMDVSEDMVELNARIIKTETAEVLATSSVQVEKEWSDQPVRVVQYRQPAQPVQQTVQQQPAQPVQQPAQEPGTFRRAASYDESPQQQPAPVTTYRKKPAQTKEDLYLDFYTGSGDGKMDLVFKHGRGRTIASSELGIFFDNDGDGSYTDSRNFSNVRFPGAKAVASMPIGLRLQIMPSKHWGMGMEAMYYSYALAKQQTKASYGGNAGTFTNALDDYLKVDVINPVSMSLMYRLTNKTIQPYVGVGLGMSINIVSSQKIRGYDTATRTWENSFTDFNIGLMTHIPVGIRLVFKDWVAFGEYRQSTNYFVYGRGIEDEADEVYMMMNYFNFGAGFRFR